MTAHASQIAAEDVPADGLRRGLRLRVVPPQRRARPARRARQRAPARRRGAEHAGDLTAAAHRAAATTERPSATTGARRLDASSAAYRRAVGSSRWPHRPPTPSPPEPVRADARPARRAGVRGTVRRRGRRRRAAVPQLPAAHPVVAGAAGVRAARRCVLHGRAGRGPGFGWGFLFGLGFLLPLLVWTGSFVGAAAVGGADACSRRCSSAWPGPGWRLVSRLPAAPVWAAAVWVAGEALRGRVPFGGLPVGAGRVRPARRAAAAAGRDRRRAAAVVRHRAGRARAGRAGAPAAVRRRRRVRARSLRRCSLVLALAAGPLAALVPAAGGRRRSAR